MKEPQSYPELLKAITTDITPRIERSLTNTIDGATIQEAVEDALLFGKTRGLIAFFVGYRHVELRERDKKERRNK